jgi:hypothetical protein
MPAAAMPAAAMPAASCIIDMPLLVHHLSGCSSEVVDCHRRPAVDLLLQ